MESAKGIARKVKSGSIDARTRMDRIVLRRLGSQFLSLVKLPIALITFQVVDVIMEHGDPGMTGQ